MSKKPENENWFAIFEAGDYSNVGKGNWPIDRLMKVVKNYKPGESGVAPIQIDHKPSAPAGGIIEKIKLVGKTLYAKPAQLAAEFIQEVRDKRFRGVSVSFSQANNTLNHVAFLPNSLPEVGGLPEAVFSKGEGGDIVYFELDNVEFEEIKKDDSKGVSMETQEIKDKLKVFINRLYEIEATNAALDTRFCELEARHDEQTRRAKTPKAVAKVGSGTGSADFSKMTKGEYYEENKKEFSRVGVSKETFLKFGTIPGAVGIGGFTSQGFNYKKPEALKVSRDEAVKFYFDESAEIKKQTDLANAVFDVLTKNHGWDESMREAFIKTGNVDVIIELKRQQMAVNSVEFSSADKGAFFDKHKDTFFKQGVSKESFMEHGEVPYGTDPDSLRSDTAQFSSAVPNVPTGDYYEQNKSVFEKAGVTREMWEKHNPQEAH